MLRRTFALGAAGCACAGWALPARAADPLPAAAERFLQLAEGLRQLAPAERCVAVNQQVNQLLAYTHDLAACGRRDCWQTPAETLASGRGDCEDYAITKYFLLGACAGGGCPRLVYARWTPADRPHDSPQEGQAHVVVIADAQAGDPLVLDCVDPPLQALSRRPDLRPVFSFDAGGLWRGAIGERVGDAPQRLWPWRGVLERWARQQRGLN